MVVGRTRCTTSSTRCAMRIISSPSFNGEKMLGAILFERTMDGEANGQPVPAYLWSKGVVPFLKIDKGLADEEQRRAADEAHARSRCVAGARAFGRASSERRNAPSSTSPMRRELRRSSSSNSRSATTGAQPWAGADHRAGSEHQERRARLRPTKSSATRS